MESVKTSGSPISVLLASDFPMLRTVLAKVFEDINGVRLVACAEMSSEVLPLADAYSLQLAVLDLNVEWEVVRDLARGLSAREIPILLMNDAIDDATTLELLRNGVSGVISR